jgi:hypothetical protein
MFSCREEIGIIEKGMPWENARYETAGLRFYLVETLLYNPG